MANADARRRQGDEDEAVPLLTTDDDDDDDGGDERPGSPRENLRRPSGFERLVQSGHAARATAHRVINIKVLWPFVPFGLVAGFFQWNSILVSVFNFMAIIPLSAIVSDLSDNLADEFGDGWGALIGATFGNAVELIVNLPRLQRVFLTLIVLYIGRYSGRLPRRYSPRAVCYAREYSVGYPFRAFPSTLL
jgi:Ca2+:H+ antiporter